MFGNTHQHTLANASDQPANIAISLIADAGFAIALISNHHAGATCAGTQCPLTRYSDLVISWWLHIKKRNFAFKTSTNFLDISNLHKTLQTSSKASMSIFMDLTSHVDQHLTTSTSTTSI